MVEEEENVISGPDETQLLVPPCSLGQMFFRQLASQPSQRVLQIDAEADRSLTCGEFLDRAKQVAQGLKEAGILQGDVVCVVGKNSIDLGVTTAGVLFLGATAAPLDPFLKKFEYLHMFRTIEPKLIVCDAEVLEEVAAAVEEFENPPPLVVLFADEEVSTGTRFEDFLAAPDPDFEPPGVEDNTVSVAFIVSSSGSTGLPKGVLLSDKALLYQIMLFQAQSASFHIPSGQLLFLHTSHFFWITGVVMFCTSLSGAFSRVSVRDLNEQNIVSAIEKFKPSICLLAPSHINSIVNWPDLAKYDVSSMRLMLTGGSAIHISTLEKVQEMFGQGMACIPAYGLSEVAGVFASARPNMDPLCVGSIVIGGRLKVVDEDGKSLGPNESGELLLKSPAMMLGYINNEEATKESIDSEGWLHTGDIGYYDDNEIIFISGRIKEFIKYQNLQIAPAELEKLIFSIPGVKDVGVAGVASDADTYLPMALVVRDEDSDVTEEDVMKIVNENMSEYKHLRGGVVFVESIPRTPTMKIRRKELAALAKTLYMNEPISSL